MALELWPRGRNVELRLTQTIGNPEVTVEKNTVFVKHSELERAVQACEANYDDPEVRKIGDKPW